MLSGTVRRFVANLWLFSQEIDCSPITSDSDIIELGNVCRHNRPISARSLSPVEFAHFGDDLGEPVRESIEATTRSVVGQSTAEHLQHMLSGEQGIDHAVEAGSKAGERQLRLRDKTARVRTRAKNQALRGHNIAS